MTTTEFLFRVEWLDHLLVHWMGKREDYSSYVELKYRPFRQILEEALEGKSPGIYALKILPARDSEINCQVEKITPVTSSLIHKTSRVLKKSGHLRQSREMTEITGDFYRWRQNLYGKLKRAGLVLESLEKEVHHPGWGLVRQEFSLLLEAPCQRPSARLDTTVLRRWISRCPLPSKGGVRMAALALGQRGEKSLWEGFLNRWYRAGQLLSRWPADLIYRFQPGMEDLRQIEKEKISPSIESALSAEEYWAFGGENLLLFLHRYQRWQAMAFELQKSLEEKWNHYRNSLIQACYSIDKDSLEKLFILRDNHGSKAFCHHFWKLIKERINWLLEDCPRRYSLPSVVKNSNSFVCHVYQTWGVVLPGDFPRVMEDFPGTTFEEIPPYLLSQIRSLACPEPPLAPHPLWEKALGLLARLLVVNRDDFIDSLSAWWKFCLKWGISGQTKLDWLKEGLVGFEMWWEFFGKGSSFTSFWHHMAALGYEEILQYQEKYRAFDPAQLLRDFLIFHPANPKEVSQILEYLSVPEIKTLFQHQLFDIALNLMRNSPRGLAHFVDWFEDNRDIARNYDFSDLRQWAKIFQISQEKLFEEVYFLFEDMREKKALSFSELSAILSSLQAFLTEPVAGDFPMADFLAHKFWILEKVVGEIEFYLRRFWERKKRKMEKRGINEIIFIVFRLPRILFFCQRGEGRDLFQISEKLLGRLREILLPELDSENYHPLTPFPETSQAVHFALEWGGENLSHLSSWMELARKEREKETTYLKGWEIARDHHRLKETLLECGQLRQEWHSRILHLLTRIALASRLFPGISLEEILAPWPFSISEEEFPKIPIPLPVDLKEELYLIHLNWKRARDEDWPRTIEKILDRPRALAREKETLDKLSEKGETSPSMEKRRENLARYLLRQNLAQNMEKDLRKAGEKYLYLSHLECLETLLDRAIWEHQWKFLSQGEIDFGEEDWKNAFRLYRHTEHNRRLLGRLLKKLAQGDREWWKKLKPNEEFLQSLQRRGINSQAWLGTFEISLSHREGQWRAYTEEDPFRVFHMGNLFGTCLSVDDFNGFSTIANAVEVNKKVLYLEDGRGTIIGRKLVILSEEGVLMGCNTYGQGQEDEKHFPSHPWVKIALEGLCAKIAWKIGAKLISEEETDQIWEVNPEEKFSLFAEWYFDGLECFDHWWSILLERDLKLDKESLLSLEEYLLESWKKERVLGDHYRCLLWLGDKALEVLKKVESQRILTSYQRKLIARHTLSEPVAKFLSTPCTKSDIKL